MILKIFYLYLQHKQTDMETTSEMNANDMLVMAIINQFESDLDENNYESLSDLIQKLIKNESNVEILKEYLSDEIPHIFLNDSKESITSPTFINNDLKSDIEKLKSFDPPITVVKSFDDNMEYPYVIDIEDNSYWYVNESDRDADYNVLKIVFEKFTFIN